MPARSLSKHSRRSKSDGSARHHSHKSRRSKSAGSGHHRSLSKHRSMSGGRHHKVNKLHHHFAKHVILPVAKKELVKMYMSGVGIHKRHPAHRMKHFTTAQAGRLARTAKLHMKSKLHGKGFWDQLKRIGKNLLSKFSSSDTLKKIFLDPAVFMAASEGLATGNPLEALGAAAAVVAKNVAAASAESIGESLAEGGKLRRSRKHKSRSRSRKRSNSPVSGGKHRSKSHHSKHRSHSRHVSAYTAITQ